MLYLVNNRLLLINNGNSLYRIDNQTQPEPDSSSFIFTIDTTLGTGSSFNLPLRSGYNYDFVVDWGDGNTNTITSYNQTEKLHTYSTGGVYTISITGLCEAWYFDDEGDKLKLTSIEQWGNTGFVNMGYAFYGCSNLTIVNDTNGTWCSSVTNMNGMFYGCSSLTTLDVSNWDVSNVSGMSIMFYGCSSLTTLDVSNWDVYSVSDMTSMFDNCSLLATLDVSNWDVSNVIHMSGMFYNCSPLTTLDVSNWDVSNVTNMTSMFRGCTSLTTLDVTNWDVTSVTNMNSMFFGCSSLETLDVSNWNVSNVTNMRFMFFNTPLNTPSYDGLLIGWSGLPSLQPNVPFDANLAKYSSGAAATARGKLRSAPNYWSINDGGQVL